MLLSCHAAKIKKYTTEDCDVMLLCDYENVYLLGPEEFEGRSNFTVRTKSTKNRQTKGCHWHEDYVLSKNRIRRILEGKA